MASEDQKAEFQIRLPDVGEYSKENLLAFEKEVLGIYISGHPWKPMKSSGERLLLLQPVISSRMMIPDAQSA